MQGYLILGAGYLGFYLANLLPNAKLVQGKIWEADTLKQLLLKEYPSHCLINCAGKTGRPNIDWCEDHKDVTFGSNVGLPVMVAETCAEIKCHWIHIGSGCIYSGYDKLYTEEDAPNFFGSFYSRTKAWSQNILSDFPEVAILRIRMPFDRFMGERNYISKIVKYAREGKTLFNEANSLTYLDDLAKVIQLVAENGLTGTYNVVNNGSLTCQQILDLYKEYVDPNLSYTIDKTENIISRLKAGRSNCLLSSEKIAKAGYVMPEVQGRVVEVLKAQKKVAV